MSKIYIVKAPSGSWETYTCYIAKAFTNRVDAEAYAKDLDREHYYKPQFITDEFEALYNECEDLLPEWEDSPISPSVDIDAYRKWIDETNEVDIQRICDLMYERGQYVSREMHDQYIRWRDDQSEEWHDCIIEEIELV